MAKIEITHKTGLLVKTTVNTVLEELTKDSIDQLLKDLGKQLKESIINAKV